MEKNQTGGLAKFMGCDDATTIEFLKFCGLIKYVPRHGKFGIVKDAWDVFLSNGEYHNTKILPYQATGGLQLLLCPDWGLQMGFSRSKRSCANDETNFGAKVQNR
jgi:hypothetical protein